MKFLLFLAFVPSILIAHPQVDETTKKQETGNELSSMYQLQESVPLPKRAGRLQGVSIKGRLMCGSEPIVGGRVKIVDIDKRPDKDDLMGDVQTGEDGQFHISGATREEEDIEGTAHANGKITWRVPKKYYNNGTFTEWFNIGTVNMELIFNGEERDCRH
ncbi:Transthyretin-like protein 46 [Aphelenchoides bicaudatus]|nr:Transthyretin-like protein 46 [Aphelenchoides bicaudatus]